MNLKSSPHLISFIKYVLNFITCFLELVKNQNTHSHSACHTVQLGSLKPHSLDNTKKRTSLWGRQRALGQDGVARNKVQLDSSLVILQCQQALPYNRIFL